MQIPANLSLIEISPLFVATIMCAIYCGHSLLFHKEIPDLNKMLPLSLSCVGVYSGLLLIASIVSPQIREIVMGQYLDYAFFVTGLVITFTSLMAMQSTMIAMHKHEDNKLRLRHVGGIFVVIIACIAIITNLPEHLDKVRIAKKTAMTTEAEKSNSIESAGGENVLPVALGTQVIVSDEEIPSTP